MLIKEKRFSGKIQKSYYMIKSAFAILWKNNLIFLSMCA